MIRVKTSLRCWRDCYAQGIEYFLGSGAARDVRERRSGEKK